MLIRIAKIVFIVFLLTYLVSARDKTNRTEAITAGDSVESLLEILDIEQFRGLTYNEFIKRYPAFWIYAMDYDEQKRPRRYMKSPREWQSRFGNVTFDNLIIVFVDNQVQLIKLTVTHNSASDFLPEDFINELTKLYAGKIIEKNDRKITVQLDDKHNTTFECYYPLDYYESGVNLYFTMN